jgi:hypothetical protein
MSVRIKTLTDRYPIATSWYRRLDLDQGVTRFWEPHVHPLEQANFWHIRGRDRDLVVDSGMGIVPLRDSFPDLFRDREIIALATHTHIDHIGAIHEEAAHMAAPSGIVTLDCGDIPQALCESFVNAGYPPFGELLIDAFPWEGYDPATYRLRGATPTRLVTEHDVIDLGARQFELLHLPGHSAGSLCVWRVVHRGSRLRRTLGVRRSRYGPRDLRAVATQAQAAAGRGRACRTRSELRPSAPSRDHRQVSLAMEDARVDLRAWHRRMLRMTEFQP